MTNTIKGLKEGQPIYRFFKEESHADQLAAGNLWISTLKTCREYEDKLQGDPKEATDSYHVGLAFSGDPESKKDLEEFFGSAPSPNANIIVDRCSRTVAIADAYVICTTEIFDPTKLGDAIGNYCVEINNPWEFFWHASRMLSIVTRQNIINARAGKITYQSRNRTKNTTDPKREIGFVKPPDPYAPQQEVRFLAEVKDTENLEPFGMFIPEISRLCRRIR